ncbi:hypothetical protein VTL71DRAFT_16282 [Oculimacula yallundae]|uniref:NAD-dependent epimerase/dehydratase domain-containing protein n=1 Tax=Oculimacula yallundae TaxID=86028 RepID=A0ABR4CE04_9HELO
MPSSIFITGASGYIGFQTLVFALEAGYIVRASVRKSTQISKLSTHQRVRPYNDQLTFVVIPDLTDVEVLVQNLKGVDAMIHLASPLAVETNNYERDIVQPALGVTSSVLTAAKRTPTIKRVVITSSAVTLIPFSWLSAPTINLYTSASMIQSTSGPWNSAMEAYWSSKALSRTFAHDFLATEKPQFDIVQLLPSVVIGPDLLTETSVDVLTNTRAMALGPLLGQKAAAPLVGASVHVRDVAKAHVDALQASVPGNEDYVLTSDSPDGIRWDDVLSIAEKYFPEAIEKGILKMGGRLETTTWKIGTEDMEKAFGWRCTSFEDTVRDLIGLYIELVVKEQK